MKISFFAVGGTIDKVYFDQLSEYQVGKSAVQDILKDARVTFDFDIQSLLKKDSLDMTEKDRAVIVEAVRSSLSERIIITHGTDTMIDTAKALKQVKGKTIVLTGAMEPAAFKSSDAAFNLGCAVAAVQTSSPGVYIAISGRVYDPAVIRKDRSRKQFVKK